MPPTQTIVVRDVYCDEHLLVAAKPAGLPTHAPAAGERGFVESLADTHGLDLGVHHRLDATTSGVVVFSCSPTGAAALAAQFERRAVTKHYLALAVGRLPEQAGRLELPLIPPQGGGQRTLLAADTSAPGALAAETRYTLLCELGPYALYAVQPVTGRTHQLRAHLAGAGAPILGDTLYGGGEGAGRLMLHAAAVELEHPTRGRLRFEVPPPPLLTPDASTEALLEALAARIVERAASRGPTARLGTPQEHGLPALKPDRYGDFLALRLYEGTPAAQGWDRAALERLGEHLRAGLGLRGVYVKTHEPPRGTSSGHSLAIPADEPIVGEPAPPQLVVEEDGVRYTASMTDGQGCRLYLDQRANRGWVRERFADGAASSLLNLFAYTCSFTAAAACGGASATTSVDLAKRALELGRDNLRLNGIEPDARHRFLARDALDMLERAAARGESWDVVVCDPPSFARRGRATFRLERDLETLVRACLAVVAPGGWLLFCANHRGIRLDDLADAMRRGASRLGRSLGESALFVTEDGLGPLGVGTDLKTLRVEVGGPRRGRASGGR